MTLKIGCIVVLYNPDVPFLLHSINSVIDQVDCVFASDNSTEQFDSTFLSNMNVVYEKMPGNVGIAAAQNVGIRYFMEHHFTHIIFLDQDSNMENGLVKQLLTEMIYLESKSILVGGVGARPIHRESNKEYRGSAKPGRLIEPDITEVSELISSSSLFELKHYPEIGLLDEGLFIDGVDHEWCWRAKMLKGLRFFISEKAHLSHQVGEGDRFFLIRDVAIPTPFRSYYQFRNYFILLRRNYVPLYWKLSNGFKYFIKLFYYPLFVKPRMSYLKKMLLGILDGIFFRK